MRVTIERLVMVVKTFPFVPATLRVPVAGWPQKRELGPLSSGQGKSMQFVDPDRIEQSDHVQAASFAPFSLALCDLKNS